MEIVRYAQDHDLENGLILKHGELYVVHDVHFSKLSGVLFELNGFTVGNSKQYHCFPANHFRAQNGKHADRVMAKPDTDAFAKYGKFLLYISGLKNVQGEELIRCRECNSLVEHMKLLPYNQFTHV